MIFILLFNRRQKTILGMKKNHEKSFTDENASKIIL